MNYEKTYSKWNKEDVLNRLSEVSNKLGYFPTKNKLVEISESRLSNAIQNLRLTYYELASELGYNHKIKPKNYWTEETILAELKTITEQNNGVFPTAEYIKVNRSDLLRVIYRTKDWRYYKSKLGYEVKEKWSKEKILERIQFNINKLGRVPSTTTLLKIDRNLLSAIDRTNETYGDLLKELGHKPIQRTNGFWKDWDNVEAIIRPYCKNNIMPPVSLLKTEIGSSVALAIADFGGVGEVADKMNVGVSPKSYLQAKDGHLLKSTYELEFDNYLHEHGIKHEVEAVICSHRKFTCDFKINDSYIEIWGFQERKNNKRCERYTKKRLEKEKLYQELNLRLISIEGSVFRKNKSTKTKIFQEIVEQATILHLTSRPRNT